MIIASPPSYLLAATYRANATGIIAAILQNISDPQLQSILNSATARADAIMCQSLLPREETLYYPGTGTQTLDLDQWPLCYVRQIAFAQPGLGGLIIPTQNILVDYATSELTTFTPLLLQGAGYVSHFPIGVMLSVRAAWGYNYTVPPPSFVVTDTQPLAPVSLTPGLYDIAVTSCTFTGESTAVPVVGIPTALGAFNVVVNPIMGAERYRVYIAPTGGPASALQCVAEVEATSFTSGPLAVTFSSLLPQSGFYAESLPQVDTTARPYPPSVIEAVRLLAGDMLLEDSNPANAGISQDGDTHYRRAEDGTAKIAGAMIRARELLFPHVYRGVL